MTLLERVSRKAAALTGRVVESEERGVTTLDDYATALQDAMYAGGFVNGNVIQETLGGQRVEKIPNDYTGFSQAYASNGPVFTLMTIRAAAFSAIRFQWQQIQAGRPGKLFGTPALAPLENPWVGGTTQDLLIRMMNDADLAGNSYHTLIGNEIIRLRPDWVSIVMEPRVYRGQRLGYKVIGYLYTEGGYDGTFDNSVMLLPEDVCHFAPTKDPLATYRGMSWLTPVIRELGNDKLMQVHQRMFFENGATPNMVISMDAAVSFEEFKKFKEVLKLNHEGVRNAYKTLVVGGGADVNVVGSNFQQMTFTAVQGRGETRLAAAAGVPVTIAGFSEGLQGSSLNAGNFSQARRRMVDITMHPLWQNAAGSWQNIIRSPSNSVRLWYDPRDVPLLREDAKDAAEILQTAATTVVSLVNGGFEPDSVKEAVISGDFAALQHTGLLSVQLQPPMTELPAAEETAPVADTGTEDNGAS